MSNSNFPKNFDYPEFRNKLDPILESELEGLYPEDMSVASLSRTRIKNVMADVAYQALGLVYGLEGQKENKRSPTHRIHQGRGKLQRGIKNRTVVIEDPNTGETDAYYINAKTTIATYNDMRRGGKPSAMVEVETWTDLVPELHLVEAIGVLSEKTKRVLYDGKFDSVLVHLNRTPRTMHGSGGLS